MGRLIEANALLSEMEKYSDDTARSKMENEYLFGMQQRLETCIELVEDAPTVDAVEVVRCKDCKHNPLDTWFDCPIAHMKYDGDRWCWKGERKDGKDGKTD